MDQNINQILATKRAWRASERRKIDRRQKDGSAADRKDLADTLRCGRRENKMMLRMTQAIKGLLKVDPPLDERNQYVLPAIVSIIVVIIFNLLFILLVPKLAHAYTDEQAIHAIIGEAENQGEQGMIYVACAIVNRGTLKGVYGLHAPRVVHHKYSEMVLNEAHTAWDLVHKEDGWQYCQAVQGASNWENTTAFGLPGWAKQMKVVLVYRDHKFFKKG